MDDSIRLEGRIIALELMMEGLITNLAMEQPLERPSQFIVDLEKAFRGSLQHLTRPDDKRSDEVWEKAADAIILRFSNVRLRIAAQKG